GDQHGEKDGAHRLHQPLVAAGGGRRLSFHGCFIGHRHSVCIAPEFVIFAALSENGTLEESGHRYKFAHARRALSMIWRINRTEWARPTNTASPTRKWPILSSTTSWIAAIGPTFS